MSPYKDVKSFYRGFFEGSIALSLLPCILMHDNNDKKNIDGLKDIMLGLLTVVPVYPACIVISFSIGMAAYMIGLISTLIVYPVTLAIDAICGDDDVADSESEFFFENNL